MSYYQIDEAFRDAIAAIVSNEKKEKSYPSQQDTLRQAINDVITQLEKSKEKDHEDE